MTAPQDYARLQRQSVSLAYRRAADACLEAANEWATVDPGVPDPFTLHARAQGRLDTAVDAIKLHDAAAAGAARGRRA